ncbi:ferredoxin [Nocardia bovistercoris]|uniref:Ferredoxin n=1 Tax=Nocardia bovistercoris TaxID=2785916 RepID=A0A931N6E7_9NOCA|nr:ferredoxin [Nocardia bovistercoris]MBH0780426.1 ferredoxin [Nocardia bovistercoris]
MPRWTVDVDREVCSGCEVCRGYAPGSFRIDSGGQAEFLDPPADALTDIRMAVANCPTGALRLLEDAVSHDQGV